MSTVHYHRKHIFDNDDYKDNIRSWCLLFNPNKKKREVVMKEENKERVRIKYDGDKVSKAIHTYIYIFSSCLHLLSPFLSILPPLWKNNFYYYYYYKKKLH